MTFSRAWPPSVQALHDGKINAAPTREKKFHAKAYITHPRRAVIRLRRSGRLQQFHRAGPHPNIELNIQVKAAGRRAPVAGMVRASIGRRPKTSRRTVLALIETPHPRISALRRLCQSAGRAFPPARTHRQRMGEVRLQNQPHPRPVSEGRLRLPLSHCLELTAARFSATGVGLGKTLHRPDAHREGS